MATTPFYYDPSLGETVGTANAGIFASSIKTMTATGFITGASMNIQEDASDLPPNNVLIANVLINDVVVLNIGLNLHSEQSDIFSTYPVDANGNMQIPLQIGDVIKVGNTYLADTTDGSSTTASVPTIDMTVSLMYP